MALVRTDPDAPEAQGHHVPARRHAQPRRHGAAAHADQRRRGLQRGLLRGRARAARRTSSARSTQGWDIAITCLMHERQTLTFSRQLQSKVALDDMLGDARSWRGGVPATRPAGPPGAGAGLHRRPGDALHRLPQSDEGRCAAACRAPRARSRSSSGARCTSASWRRRVRDDRPARRSSCAARRTRSTTGAGRTCFLYSQRPHDRRRHLRGAAQHHRRARAGPAARGLTGGVSSRRGRPGVRACR